MMQNLVDDESPERRDPVYESLRELRQRRMRETLASPHFPSFSSMRSSLVSDTNSVHTSRNSDAARLSDYEQ